MKKKTTTQAFVSNFSYFPDYQSFEDAVIYGGEDGRNNLDVLLEDEIVNWSVPRWSHEGDIILFLYSKKSINKINMIAKTVKLEQQYHQLTGTYSSSYDRRIERDRQLYKKYGGAIVGFGRLAEDPGVDFYNYKKQTGATITDIHILEEPLPVSKFTSFLRINQGGITPVWGEWYERIKQMIIETNDDLPQYFLESSSMSDEEANINEKTWIKENIKRNFNYIKEEEFRTFYCDYLLKELSDDGILYTECACYKEGMRYPSYADYVISIGDKWLPVEVKIDISIEQNLDYQVSKYCELTDLLLDPKAGEYAVNEDLIQTRVLIVDERRIQIYKDETGLRYDVIKLEEIKSKRDVKKLRETIISLFEEM